LAIQKEYQLLSQQSQGAKHSGKELISTSTSMSLTSVYSAPNPSSALPKFQIVLNSNLDGSIPLANQSEFIVKPEIHKSAHPKYHIISPLTCENEELKAKVANSQNIIQELNSKIKNLETKINDQEKKIAKYDEDRKKLVESLHLFNENEKIYRQKIKELNQEIVRKENTFQQTLLKKENEYKNVSINQ